MSNFDSVIDGLDRAADIYDFHPEVPHLHRDWAHPATSAPGLGSPCVLPPAAGGRDRSGGTCGYFCILENPLGCVPACRSIRCNPSPQVWKSTEAVGWEKMVLPGKVVPFS
jgi:hypothetical protein